MRSTILAFSPLAALAGALLFNGAGAQTTHYETAQTFSGVTLVQRVETGPLGFATFEGETIGRLYGQPHLIGQCDGRLMVAIDESDFPAGCTWIQRFKRES